MTAGPDTVLWRFECPRGHGEFDVWALDWTDVDEASRPAWMRSQDLAVEAEDASATRCPACKAGGYPVRTAG